MIPDVVGCALAGVRAVDPFDSVAVALGGLARAGSTVSVVAAGKAAVAMARGAQFALGAAIARGIIIAPVAGDVSGAWTMYVGGHPIPNAVGMRGACAVRDLVETLGSADILLCLLSGGASALMTLPAEGITLAEMQQATQSLLRAGATIDELNCVRKHLDQLKGGRLAALAAPARVVTLILSDVVGDPVDVIASGPTVADPTTVADAVAILTRRGVWDQLAPAIRTHLRNGADESPKSDDARLAHASWKLVGSNTKAAQAAAAHATSLGYAATIVTTSLTGEAREVGATIAREAVAQHEHAFANISGDAPPGRRAVIYAGETTVTVTGGGTGGRNQELVLAAAITLDGTSGITITSIGTDGIDGPTDAAGAWADGTTLQRARALGLDPTQALADNDAYPFWTALDALVMTGPTGTNVMDLIVVTMQ